MVKSRLTRQEVLELIEAVVGVDAGALAADEVLLQELERQLSQKGVIISRHALRMRLTMLEQKDLVSTRMVLADGRQRLAIRILSPADFQAYLRRLIRKKRR